MSNSAKSSLGPKAPAFLESSGNFSGQKVSLFLLVCIQDQSFSDFEKGESETISYRRKLTGLWARNFAMTIHLVTGPKSDRAFRETGASGSVVWRKGKEKTPPKYQDFLLAGIASLADYFFAFFPHWEAWSQGKVNNNYSGNLKTHATASGKVTGSSSAPSHRWFWLILHLISYNTQTERFLFVNRFTSS